MMFRNNRQRPVRAVLFDLDGTLVDTAPDLAYALNRTLEQQGRPPLDLETIRPLVSHGGSALIRAGFGISPGEPGFEARSTELLAVYADNLSRCTTLFPGMDAVLERLEKNGIAWGVVTNKPSWLTDPLMRELGLTSRATCIISGDTTPNAKPHPDPLLHACRLSGCLPAECLYVGDAERDIRAGEAAGTHTLIALFGYIAETDSPEKWGADGLIHDPRDILQWLGLLH
jgi:phosphoglycolate phosphatase